MTIDEAIVDCKENDLWQIAEWLEELKVYQQHEIICNKGYNAGYNKAVDDFVKMAYDELLYNEHLSEIDIDYIAEQLREGENYDD